MSGANFGISDVDSASFTYTVSGVSGGIFQLIERGGHADHELHQRAADGRVWCSSSTTATRWRRRSASPPATAPCSSNTLAATVTYNPVNDAPVAYERRMTVSEGQTVTLSAANFGVTDPDSSALPTPSVW